MAKGKDKLAEFLKEVSNWSWEEFARAEKDPEYTTNQAVVFALIRSCAMQSLSAIKIALNRLDGKLKTPVEIEMPKVFYLYPCAAGSKTAADPASPALPDPVTDAQADRVIEGELIIPPEPDPKEDMDEPGPKDLPSMGFRETLREMSDFPRTLPLAITELALQTEQWLRNQAPKPQEIPRVKSVVAAHLLIMAQNRNIDALTEVFDQIDGKLTETIQILGEDIYITNYSAIAPPEATLNEDGILQVEATQAQNIWAQRLGEQK